MIKIFHFNNQILYFKNTRKKYIVFLIQMIEE